MTTLPLMSPRTSVREAAWFGLPACGPHRPSLPPSLAPRTPSLPAAVAWPPPPQTGFTSAQAFGTSFCTHGMVSEPWALPGFPPATRALHLAASFLPLFARPTCVVLFVHRRSSLSSTPLRTVDSSQAAAGLVLDLLFLVPDPLATFLLSACISWLLLAAPFFRLASSVPRSCARWAINSLPRPGLLPRGLSRALLRSVAQCAPSWMFQSK